MHSSTSPIWLSLLLLVVPSAWADDSGIVPPAFNNVQEEDAAPSCFGSIIKVSNTTLTDNADGTCSVSTGGGGGNSFETIAVPAGASVVADSSTDTLTLTETSFLTLTGTAATDTIDITQVTTDLGTDGLIAANAVALGTDTTGAYVADLTAGTYIDVSGGGAETANITVTVDATEIEAVTFGAGGNASNLWTINVSGTDPTLLWGSAAATLTGVLTSDGLTMGTDENLTIGSDTLTFAAGTSDFELSDDLSITDATPHLQLIDSTVSEDDFELYADASQVYLTNVTDAIELIRFNASNNLFLRGGSVTYSWPTVDGTNTQVLTTNGSGVLTWQDDDTGAGGGDPILIDGVAVTDASGVNLIQGTTGIDITFDAGVSPDTATFSFDATEISSLTWGAGAFTTMTFNAGAIDPILTAASDTLTLSDSTFVINEDVTNGNLATFKVTNAATYSVSGAREIRGASIVVSSDGAANNTDEQTALFINNSKDAGNGTLAELGGIDTNVNATSSLTSTITSLYGHDILVTASADNGSTSTTLTGVTVQVDAALSDFTNAYGVKILLDGDTGSVGTNRYALHITDGSQALGGSVTNEYGIFQVGSAQNQLADLDISDVTPHLRLTDTTAAQDDFEWYADASQVYLTNVTDAVELLRWSSTNAFFLRGSSVTYGWPTADGTNGQFLTTNGSGTMTWTTSSGSGDITDVFNCSSGDCASIVAGATDLLNFSGNDSSTTTEGLILPQHATTCAGGTAEGQVCWDADSDALLIGNGATLTTVGSGSDTNADLMIRIPAVAMMPLEAAESIPPIAKDTGTNIDQLVVDFDQSTDECRTATIEIPADITAGGTVTFTFWWYSASVTTNEVIWDIRHNSGVAEGVDPDAALTTVASAADTVAGTACQLTRTTFTETQTNLAWIANDLVDFVACRDANNAGDDFAADARLKEITINIPRS